MMDNDGKGVGWAVTAQQEVTAPDANGRYVPGVRVSFQTARGLTGTVFVPDQQYNAATVRAAVNARVDLMHSINDLGA